MKKTITLLSSVFISFISFSQTQIDNPGFENWENAGTSVDEPTNWSSIKTSDDPTLSSFAPVVWGQSTDAHSGNYSLEMTNVSTFGVVANGIVTNGRVHADFDPSLGYVFSDLSDDTWHQTFSDKPDSLVGWYKYSPANNDKAKVEAVLHASNAQIPENGTQSNWVGRARADFVSANSNWTRFSVPFNYFNASNPEYILLVLTSGDSTVAENGSQLLLDDLELVYSPLASINNNNEEIDFWFSDNTFYTQLNNSNASFHFQVYDLSGKLVLNEIIRPFSSDKYELDLPKGMYVVNLSSATENHSLKIIMQ
ncbi:MAG: PCMD domain-containing protein [Parvicellaceae bacterium]